MLSLVAGARVDTLLDAGDVEAAERAAEAGLALRWQGMGLLLPFECRLARGRALAWARQGRHADAIAELERRLAQVEPLDSPMLSGMLYEALALVADGRGDAAGARHHGKAAARLFDRTSNPVLVARARRLLVREAGARLDSDDLAHTVEVPRPSQSGNPTHRSESPEDPTETDVLRKS